MKWPIEEHAITDLYLDDENIRIPEIGKAQDALIRDMFENENAFDLVKRFVQKKRTVS